MNKKRRGWFKIDGKQDGDRTIEQQMRGLDLLLAEVKGKVVLDLGCAEGLISQRLVQHGAQQTYGLEVVDEHVHVANTLQPAAQMRFVCQDLNDKNKTEAELAKVGKVDVCIMLAILHKLRDPGACVSAVVLHNAPDLIIIRTAERTPGYVYDERSFLRRYDPRDHLKALGYGLEHTCFGPNYEWMGYFRKA